MPHPQQINAPAIFKTNDEVELQLKKLFGVTKDELIKVAEIAVWEGNNSVETDPSNGKGLLMYIHGTRALRSLFMTKGWKMDRTDNVESTYDPQTGNRVIYQNAEHAAYEIGNGPKAISDKGSASERMIERSHPWLFKEFEETESKKTEQQNKIKNGPVWYLFVSVNGEEYTAELSRPYLIENGQFRGFTDRIFIINKGERNRLNLSRIDNNLDQQDFQIQVNRK